MSLLSQRSILAALCLLCSQPGQAQPAACAGGPACLSDRSETAWSEGSRVKLASLIVHQRCPGAAVDVTAAHPEERQLACSAANDAIDLLARCGISPRRPLRVQIQNEVRHPLNGPILGLLDTRQEKVLVTTEANVPAMVKDTPYAKLPLRDFYKSLIVHEVVHGVMHQNLRRQATTHAAYEYPAYALQIESLPPDVRDSYLRVFDQASIEGDSALFSDIILFFDPYYFAARAYRHFKAAPDGCTHLRALLDGDVAFIAPM